MRLEITNIELMKQIMTIISTIIQYDEMYIVVRDNSVGYHGVDGLGHHVIQIEMPKEDFEGYDIDKGGIFHINSADLAGLVRIAKTGDTIILEVKDNEFFATVKNEQVTNESIFGILGEDSDPAKKFRPRNIAGREFASNATMKADLLLQAMKTASFGDGEILFTHSEHGLEVTSENDSMTKRNKAKIDYSGAEVKDIVFLGEIENKKGVMVKYDPIHISRYFLDNVKTLTKVLKTDDEIKLSMFDKGPLRVVKSIGNTMVLIGFMPIIDRVL